MVNEKLNIVEMPMIRLVKLLLTASAALTLTSCGFEPVYADKNLDVIGELSDVEIVPINFTGDAGFQLEQNLRNRFNTQENKSNRYKLEIRLRESRNTLAVARNANVIRFNYNLTADYRITDYVSKKRKIGKISTVSGYGVVDSQYATLVGEEDAVKKATVDLADKLELELALYIKGARDIKISPTAPPERERSDEIGPQPERIDQAEGVQIDERFDEEFEDRRDDTIDYIPSNDGL